MTPMQDGHRLESMHGIPCAIASYALAFHGTVTLKRPRPNDISCLAEHMLRDFSEHEGILRAHLDPEPTNPPRNFVPLFDDLSLQGVTVIANSLSQLADRRRITLYNDTPTGRLAILLRDVYLPVLLLAKFGAEDKAERSLQAAERALDRHAKAYEVSSRKTCASGV